MRTIEASGKTIDEAIFNGLKELEVSIDEVEIDIVQHETKGILGIGAKPAIVKLTEREPEQIVVPDYMNEAERRANRRREDRPRRRCALLRILAQNGALFAQVRDRLR